MLELYGAQFALLFVINDHVESRELDRDVFMAFLFRLL